MVRRIVGSSEVPHSHSPASYAAVGLWGANVQSIDDGRAHIHIRVEHASSKFELDGCVILPGRVKRWINRTVGAWVWLVDPWHAGGDERVNGGVLNHSGVSMVWSLVTHDSAYFTDEVYHA